MDIKDTILAVFDNHAAAEAAVKKLIAADFPMQDLSVVGKGYHTEERVKGFYNAGDRMVFWGSRGAFWGGLWGLFLGGVFLTIPVGPVIALGYVGATLIAAVESALAVGGLSAIGAGLYSLGIPKDSALRYETAIEADGFVVMARGSRSEILRAKAMLDELSPKFMDVQADVKARASEVVTAV